MGQRDNAEKIMRSDDNGARNPGRQRELEQHKEMAVQLYERFPGLKVPKGRSDETDNPEMIDWSEPSEFDMMKAIVRKCPDELAKLGEPVETEIWTNGSIESGEKHNSSHQDFPGSVYT